MNASAQGLGRWVARRRHAVVLAWLLLAVAGAWLARALPQRVVEGPGTLAGSASARVEQTLRTDFARPLVEPLVLAIASERHVVDEAPFHGWVQAAVAILESLPEVRQVLTPPTDAPSLMTSRDGHRAIVLIDLAGADATAREHAVPVVRAALDGLAATIRRDDAGARVALTGRAAVIVDNDELNRHAGERAEQWALPFTLLALGLCFGTLAAAALPLAVGLAVTAVALGLGSLVAQVTPVSGLLVNVVKMLALALGIDYALLAVGCWRSQPAAMASSDRAAAVVADAGTTIAWSGLAVLVGLGGLLFSPLLETRSIGLAGMLVVALAVAAAWTLLPALLTLLGPHLEWPPTIARALSGLRSPQAWSRLAAVVTHRPWPVLALATAVTAGLAAPALWARSGFDAGAVAFTAHLPSRVADTIVAEIGRAQLALPIHVVLRSTDATPVLGQRRPLQDWLTALERDPRVAAVVPPLAAFDAGLADASLSRNGRALVMQVFAGGAADLATVQGLARDIAATPPGAALAVDVGGPPVFYADHVERVQASLLPVFAFVVGASLVLLFIVFRSWLLPVKAVGANLLAVAAGYGAVVAVFQFGWLGGWLGLSPPLAAIPPVVPLLMFCLSFGLSMDYEVFLLRAVQRRWRQSGDNAAAAAGALVATAPVITGAAGVMAIVFASYLATDVVLLKMLGLGLAVTVLVDATLIRCLIVPALVCVAGRWNWVPGVRPALDGPR